MPRVSAEYRQARRDEIARAALRVLERKGVRDTSIADIVAESGLSTGAIYSHFTNKGELARYIVSEFMLPRLDAIAASAEVRAPRQIIELMLAATIENGISPAVILQFWAEGSMPGEIRDELLRTIVKLRSALAAALLPWARQRTADEEEAAALAYARTVDVAAVAQGFISNEAIFGTRSPQEYLTAVEQILA
ncbi:TetR/AcrR family transcriptional regulator [Microbacterium deminutum]|uniref:HTH tetR-type domain-containing protein n=1 Tax=Microbacterium deminutum TaxID=344164 RepID=A0ABN2R8W7_9MICO